MSRRLSGAIYDWFRSVTHAWGGFGVLAAGRLAPSRQRGADPQLVGCRVAGRRQAMRRLELLHSSAIGSLCRVGSQTLRQGGRVAEAPDLVKRALP
jgi:hypothetical protein